MEERDSVSVSGRVAYREELTELAYNNEKIICIEADLGGKHHPFQISHPDRFFNMGIAEMASIDMAAGLAEVGFIPFFSTFSSFAALRGAESIKLAMGYMKKNIKIVAPYGGVAGGWFGTTHHCLEDISIIQSFQDIKIACPHGETETRKVIQEAAVSKEPYYIRLSRNDAFQSIYRNDDISCEEMLIEGLTKSAELCLISVGEQATEICKEVKAEYPSISHVHICYIDIKNLKKYAEKLTEISNKFIVVEEHRATGSVASYLSLLLPKCKVFSHNCGEKWPEFGGQHKDILSYLNFGIVDLKEQVQTIL
jgi:transketolase